MSRSPIWSLAPVLTLLLACGGGRSPSEPPPVVTPQPVTANAITITQVLPAPGGNLAVGTPVNISFHYETLVQAEVGCWLTKDGAQVGGHSGRVVDAGTRGNERSEATVSLNNFQFGVTHTDGITCAIQEDHFPLPATTVQSASMPAAYTWFVR